MAGAKNQAVLLLGAGASADAGVPTAYALTETIYGQLRRSNPNAAELFGFVYSKLLTRQVRMGGSPFDQINVEEVYDALRRFLDRSSDSLSEFVTSWDEGLGSELFDSAAFESALKEVINKSIGSALRGSRLTFERSLYNKVSRPIEGSFSRFGHSREGKVLYPYIDALVESLAPKHKNPEYMRELVHFCIESVSEVATLNYDLLCEEACKQLGYSYSYGLDSWNTSKVIRFEASDLKIMKLHGSINWVEDGDNVEVKELEGLRGKRALIFGGASQKLVPHGPYLQLRSSFERRIRKTDRVGIIGYSFQDAHMNAILRVWMATKRLGKLVILDPGALPHRLNQMGRWFEYTSGGKAETNIEVVQVKKGAAEGLHAFIAELREPPDTSAEKREGKLFRVVE